MRCPRCDVLDAPNKHRCAHKRPCVPFHDSGHCAQCKAFKAQQLDLPRLNDSVDAKPFVKWAGGKRQLVPQLLKHVDPEFCGRYFEPFVGGGAMFYALKPETAVLADINQRLIRTFIAIQCDVERVIHQLKGYPFSKRFFLELRQKPIDERDDVAVACWFLYLNKTAFNGMYRVNKSNGYNVPWGDYTNPTICDEPTLRAASRVLRNTKLTCADFEKATEKATEGDLVYFDPPYVPASTTANFTSYTKGKFGLNDHIRLRDVALRLKKRGVHVMITNSNTKTVRELYENGFTIHRLQARSSVAAKKESRGKRVDLLMV